MSEAKRLDHLVRWEGVNIAASYMAVRDEGKYVLATDYDALAAQVACLRQHKTDYMEAAEQTRNALAADNQRLREALEFIAKLHIIPPYMTPQASQLILMKGHADAALAKLRNGSNNAPCVLTDGPAEFNETAVYLAPQHDAELIELKSILPELDDALENLELHGRHSDQGYRQLKDWYRKVANATARIDAKLATLRHV